jgi:hypothetical protein
VKQNLPPEELASLNELLPGVVVNIVESILFAKIMFKGDIFYSQRCRNVKKRNSYTVSFPHHTGVLSYGYIAYFLKVVLDHSSDQVYHLAAIHQLEHCPGEGILCGLRSSLTHNVHLKPFKHVR